MAHADDPERPCGRDPALCPREVRQHGGHPLQDAPRIAAGGRRHADAVRRAPCRVDVVEADGRRRDEPHGGAGEQRLVASRARADDERVGVADGLGSDLPSRQVADLRIGFEHAPQKRNGAVGDDFHKRFVGLFRAAKIGKN